MTEQTAANCLSITGFLDKPEKREQPEADLGATWDVFRRLMKLPETFADYVNMDIRGRKRWSGKSKQQKNVNM